MRELYCGLRPPCRRARGSLCATVALSALLAAGCGHTQKYTYPGSYVGATVTPAVQQQQARVEMEGDGMPPQAPPRAGLRQMPDDPTQPWSPNYGGPASPPLRKVSAAPSGPAQGGPATAFVPIPAPADANTGPGRAAWAPAVVRPVATQVAGPAGGSAPAGSYPPPADTPTVYAR